MAIAAPEVMNEVTRIRNYYQHNKSESLRRRRKIVNYSLLGLGNAALMTLHQTGILRRLPDLPFKCFDANSITISPKAFEMSIPDGPLASLAYASLMTLATFGGDRKLRRPRVVDKLLFGTAIVNAIAAYQYQYNMIFKQKKICLYCVTATVINTAVIPLAWKELKIQ